MYTSSDRLGVQQQRPQQQWPQDQRQQQADTANTAANALIEAGAGRWPSQTKKRARLKNELEK